MAGSLVRRVVVPTAVAALASSCLAIAINLATAFPTEAWLWLVVAGLTTVTFLTSLWLQHRAAGATTSASTPTPGAQTVDNSRVTGSLHQISHVRGIVAPGEDHLR